MHQFNNNVKILQGNRKKRHSITHKFQTLLKLNKINDKRKRLYSIRNNISNQEDFYKKLKKMIEKQNNDSKQKIKKLNKSLEAISSKKNQENKSEEILSKKLLKNKKEITKNKISGNSLINSIDLSNNNLKENKSIKKISKLFPKIHKEITDYKNNTGIHSYRPYWLEGYNEDKNNNNDKYIPKGFKWVERLINEETKKINKSFSIRESIRKHNFESDIFNIKYKIINQSNTERRNYQKTSIFNLTNYKFKNIEENKNNSCFKYTSIRESNSFWEPKIIMPSLLNYSSTSKNLFNENIKNISKTKKEIEDDCHKINPNFNCGYKQNSICDFMNITRVYSPSPNKDYLNVLKNNEKAVFKKSEISKIFINHKI